MALTVYAAASWCHDSASCSPRYFHKGTCHPRVAPACKFPTVFLFNGNQVQMALWVEGMWWEHLKLAALSSAEPTVCGERINSSQPGRFHTGPDTPLYFIKGLITTINKTTSPTNVAPKLDWAFCGQIPIQLQHLSPRSLYTINHFTSQYVWVHKK